jgi:hypothetical protein
MKLYVDDIRRCPEGWEIARTNAQAIRILASQEVEEISIDHDICVYIRKNHIIQTIDDNFTPIAYYISVMPIERRPKKITIHSANAWGAKNIKAILSDVGIESEIVLGKFLVDIDPQTGLAVEMDRPEDD